MPAEVELTLAIPPELGAAAEVLAELEHRVRAVEAQVAAERQRTGQRVCGRRAVLQQSWRGQPVSREPRRNLRPRVAARNQWARVEALLRNREFIIAYTEARKTWREDATVKFPPGTYWLRRLVNVPIAEN
jgi:putative transposase